MNGSRAVIALLQIHNFVLKGRVAVCPSLRGATGDFADGLGWQQPKDTAYQEIFTSRTLSLHNAIDGVLEQGRHCRNKEQEGVPLLADQSQARCCR